MFWPEPASPPLPPSAIFATPGRAAAAPITIVINQSPWFDSFRKTVELYEKETGNKVELDVNPFAGSLEKQRNSVRASKGQYDLLIMNSGWFAEMYFGGFVEAITDIDPSFKLDPDVYTLNDTVYFDPAKKVMTPSGKLMSMPISPLIPAPVLSRRSLQGSRSQGAGNLRRPRGQRRNASTSRPAATASCSAARAGRPPCPIDFYPYLYGFRRRPLQGPGRGDYTVILNNDAGPHRARLLHSAGQGSRPSARPPSMDQADVIQNMLTGKTAHIMAVIAAWSPMDDPDKSAVVDKVEFAPTPARAAADSTASGLGHWLGGMARNMPDDRKRGVVEFFRWFQTKEAQMAIGQGSAASRSALRPIAIRSPQERRFRWMKPLAESLPHAINMFQFPEAERGDPHPRARPQPGHRRQHHARSPHSTAWRIRSTA